MSFSQRLKKTRAEVSEPLWRAVAAFIACVVNELDTLNQLLIILSILIPRYSTGNGIFELNAS
jgi:hypothetical protein